MFEVQATALQEANLEVQDSSLEVQDGVVLNVQPTAQESLPATSSALTKSSRPSVRAGWARCIEGAIPN
jgi:hypothetical protein